MPEYGESGSPSDYQEDHLISLELGGNPTDPKNLWPEPYPRAADVDKIENELNAKVCSGELTLAAGPAHRVGAEARARMSGASRLRPCAPRDSTRSEGCRRSTKSTRRSATGSCGVGRGVEPGRHLDRQRAVLRRNPRPALRDRLGSDRRDRRRAVASGSTAGASCPRSRFDRRHWVLDVPGRRRRRARARLRDRRADGLAADLLAGSGAADDTVLVLGASGTLGSVAVRGAKPLGAKRVIGAARRTSSSRRRPTRSSTWAPTARFRRRR